MTPKRPLPRSIKRAAAAGAVLLLAALLIAFAQDTNPLSFDNERLIERGAVLSGGDFGCQGGEFVPGDAGIVRIWVSTAGNPGGRLGVYVYDAGHHLVASGSTLSGYDDSPVNLSVKGLRSDLPAATVCIRNEGAQQVAVMGSAVPASAAVAKPRHMPHLRTMAYLPGESNSPATVNGMPYPDPLRMRLEWHQRRSISWLALAPEIARRTSYVRASFVGSWTFWVVIALMLATLPLGLVALVRATRA